MLLKKIISIFPVSTLRIPFLIHNGFPSFPVVVSCCRLRISSVISTISNIAHSLLIYWILDGFTWQVFLSKLPSVLLTKLKLLTIISSLMSLLLKCFISIPSLVLSSAISVNQLYFSAEKQTPGYTLSLSCTEKLKYFLFLSF